MPRSSNSRSKTRKSEPVKAKPAARAPSIRGEKRVKATAASVPVGPSRRRRGAHDGPTEPAAVDRRTEIIGTDQPAETTPGKPARRKDRGGGSSASSGKSGNDKGGGGIGLPAYS